MPDPSPLAQPSELRSRRSRSRGMAMRAGHHRPAPAAGRARPLAPRLGRRGHRGDPHARGARRPGHRHRRGVRDGRRARRDRCVAARPGRRASRSRRPSTRSRRGSPGPADRGQPLDGRQARPSARAAAAARWRRRASGRVRRGDRVSRTRTARAARRSLPNGRVALAGARRLLTHCNTGRLATAGDGTALGDRLRDARRPASSTRSSRARRGRSSRARG